MTNIAQQAVKASTAKRIVYGIDIKVGSTPINEFGLHESYAKQVNRILELNGDKPFTTRDGLTISRRVASGFAAELAEIEASLKAVPAEGASE